MGVDNLYSGTEEGICWQGSSPEPETVFVVRPPLLPPNAIPIFDDEQHVIIGFRQGSGGVYRIYDLYGNLVGMDEVGLETPLFDPIDLILIVYGLVEAFGKSGIQLARSLTVAGMRGSVTAIGRTTLVALRAALRQLLLGELKFTAKTAIRMMEAGRHVPIQILRLAIKFGTRIPDPQGAIGAFEYSIPMFRNNIQYTLKIVLREADNTILHFHYFR